MYVVICLSSKLEGVVLKNEVKDDVIQWITRAYLKKKNSECFQMGSTLQPSNFTAKGHSW